jgi:hypothetical protein
MSKLSRLEHDLDTPSAIRKAGFVFGKARIKTGAGWGKFKQHNGTLVYEVDHIEIDL